MESTKLISLINNGELDAKLTALYGGDHLDAARKRYVNAINAFTCAYGERDVSIYTVAGRSELSGNHTDHNRGCVIAASISLDIIAVASPTADGTVTVTSEGYGEDKVDIDS